MLTMGGLSAAGCGRPEAARADGRDEAKPIKAERVRQEQIHRAVEVVGSLAAQDEVTISAETDGRVNRLFADLGDRVSAGQVLVELDREKLGYNLDQQRAALDRALAKYGAPDAGRLPPIEQTPDVKKAEAELAQAKQALERADELNRRSLVPRQTLDDARTTFETKQAAYESALQNAKNLRADIDASNASLKLADRQLRDASVRAPFEGYVQKRNVSLGEFVKSQTPVMSIVRVDPLKVAAEIPEKLAPWIKEGQRVELRVDAFPDRMIDGTIARISPAVNPATRAFSFEATVPNRDASLKPGTFARVHIETTKVDDVITIPYDALQYRYGVNRAFVVTDGQLAAREVQLGDREGDRVEVTTGLNARDVIALTDVDKLADGLKVKVTDAF